MANHATVHSNTPKPWLLPREGLTAAFVQETLKSIIFNPILQGALLYGLLYRPSDLESVLPERLKYLARSAQALKVVQVLLGVGIFRKINHFLTRKVQNNWVTDTTYDWPREIALITGGASGIGLSVAVKLAQKGTKCIIWDIQPPRATLPHNVFYYKADITSSEAIATTAAQVRKEHGEPTILVNNAGTGSEGLVTDPDVEEKVKRVFNVNTISHFLMCKEFLPAMVKRNHGHIVTVASMASYTGGAAHLLSYSCSKASAMAFHEGLAQEIVHMHKAPRVRTTYVSYLFSPQTLMKIDASIHTGSQHQ